MYNVSCILFSSINVSIFHITWYLLDRPRKSCLKVFFWETWPKTKAPWRRTSYNEAGFPPQVLVEWEPGRACGLNGDTHLWGCPKPSSHTASGTAGERHGNGDSTATGMRKKTTRSFGLLWPWLFHCYTVYVQCTKTVQCRCFPKKITQR